MSGGLNIFGMISGLGKSFDDSYEAGLKARQEREAPALIDGLLKNYQPGAADPATGGPGAGLPAPSAQPGRLPAFAGGDASMRIPAAGGPLETRFIDALKAGGLTNPAGLAAMAAYANRESGYKPSAITGSWSDPSESGQPGTSGGILSWRGDRFANMRRFTAGAEDPVTAQAKFALTENPTLTQSLQNAKSAEEANSLMANAWRFAGYDRPGGGEHAARLGTTRAYLARLGGAPAETTQVAQPQPARQPTAPAFPSSARPGGPAMTMPNAPAQQATAPILAQADAADAPVPGARPAGFVIPPGPAAAPAAGPAATGFPGFASGGSRMAPELSTALTAAWRNPNTRSVATAVLNQILTGKDSSWSIADLGNGRKALFDAKSARLVPLPGTGDQYVNEVDTAGNQFNTNAATGKREVLIRAPEATSDQRNFQQSMADPRFQGYLDAQRRPLTPTMVSPGQAVLPPGEYATPSYIAPPVEKDERTAEQKDYEAAKKEGYNGSLVDFINMKGNANRAQTTINNAVNPVLKGLGDQFVEGAGAARASADSVRSIQNARAQLDAPGGIYAGAFAENRLALQKLGSFLGVADPSAIQNTETFRTQIKPIVLDTVKGLGAGSGISNADRDFALQAVGGDIKLDEGTIRRVLDVTERAARSKIDRHNTLAEKMLETQPELKQVGPMLQVDAPAAQKPPQPASAPKQPAPKYGSVKIPMEAVRDLKGLPDTPENRAYFDGIFGEGAAARVLGRSKQ